MRLKDYRATYAVDCDKLTIRGVAEWLEQQAAELEKFRLDQAAERITAGAFRTAAEELREQIVVSW